MVRGPSGSQEALGLGVMRGLSSPDMGVAAGWATHVEVLRHLGAVIEDVGGCLVIRSPHNPGHRWGNCLIVTEPDRRDDADRWIARFDEEFPDADYVAIGLPAHPTTAPWAQHGLQIESEFVLASSEPCPARPLGPGYSVRLLAGDPDWAAFVAADIAENRAEGAEPEEGFAVFAARMAEARAAMTQAGVAAFFGAFAPDGSMAARLGIVLCGPIDRARQVARYQHVATAAGHRNRGLASHLLGVAARWAAERGADRWEIHTEPGTVAHRLYDSMGFIEVGRTWQVEGKPGAWR